MQNFSVLCAVFQTIVLKSFSEPVNKIFVAILTEKTVMEYGKSFKENLGGLNL